MNSINKMYNQVDVTFSCFYIQIHSFGELSHA